MKPSRNLLSLPIVSLSEGQHIGYVRQLVIDRQSKTIAAIVIDPKGFFKDQRIIPYNKVISVGDDAITIDKGSHVEKATSIPEILNLLKDKSSIIGTKVVTETGKTLGITEEYYVDPANGQITLLEISGGRLEGFLNGKALLDANYVLTMGHDIIVAAKDSENNLQVADKGLSETLKTVLHSTSHLTSETSQALSKYFKRQKPPEAAGIPNKSETAQLTDQSAFPPEPESELLPPTIEGSIDSPPIKGTLG